MVKVSIATPLCKEAGWIDETVSSGR